VTTYDPREKGLIRLSESLSLYIFIITILNQATGHVGGVYFPSRYMGLPGKSPKGGLDTFPENQSGKNTDLAMQPLKGHLNSKEVAASLKRCPDTNLEFLQPLKACLFQAHL
jgi:hypothetical protein